MLRRKCADFEVGARHQQHAGLSSDQIIPLLCLRSMHPIATQIMCDPGTWHPDWRERSLMENWFACARISSRYFGSTRQ